MKIVDEWLSASLDEKKILELSGQPNRLNELGIAFGLRKLKKNNNLDDLSSSEDSSSGEYDNSDELGDDELLEVLIGYHKIYQAVMLNNDTDLSLLYRLRDMEAVSKKAEIAAFGSDSYGNPNYRMDVRCDFSDAIHMFHLNGGSKEIEKQKIADEAVKIAGKFVKTGVSDELKSGLMRELESLLIKAKSIYGDLEEQLRQNIKDGLYLITQSSLLKDIKYTESEIKKLEEKLLSIYLTGKPPIEINKALIEACRNTIMSPSLNLDDNLKKRISSGFNKDGDFADQITQVTDDSTKLMANKFSRLHQLSSGYFTYISAQSDHVTQFFNMTTQHHQLTSIGCVYAPRPPGHSRNANMVWMLANLRAGRRFHVLSPINVKNKMRTEFPGTPSAFASELVAAIKVGYTLDMRNGDLYLECPTDKSHLKDIRYEDVVQDMQNEQVRKQVIAKYEKLEGKVKEQFSGEISTLSSDDKLKYSPSPLLTTASSGASNQQAPALKEASGSKDETIDMQSKPKNPSD